MARGRGRKKQAQKPSKTALEELLGEEAREEDEEATQATQQPWLAQSQKLYRHHAAFTDSQIQSQSQSQHTSPSGKSKHKKEVSDGKEEQESNKKTSNDNDSSATEASDEEGDETDAESDEHEKNTGRTKGLAKPSLLSYDDPIPDFEKLIKQGGMMTSTSMRQSESSQRFFSRIYLNLY